MITEKKLQYFIEVCKTENISLAARNLFIFIIKSHLSYVHCLH